MFTLGIILSLLMVGQSNKGIEWRELFAAHEELLNANGGGLLREQFEKHPLPPISDPRIKEIPIVECREALVDLRKVDRRCRIQMMPDPKRPFESPDCNSGLPSASLVRKTIFERLEQMVAALDRLASVFGYAPGQIEIRVFEGLRDLATQKQLFENKLEEIRAASPHLTLEEARKETSKWVSPVENNIPVHSTGAAVDLRLWDNQAEAFVDMGPFGVIWGANPNAVSFSEGISERQKRNRFYCLLAAASASLTNYSYEFWHFSSGDRYDAWLRKKPQADYTSAVK